MLLSIVSRKKEGYRTRLIESLETALKLIDGEAIVENLTQGTEKAFLFLTMPVLFVVSLFLN